MRTVLMIIQILVSLGLIATVLLQSGHAAGLSGSIAGGAEAVFGKSKGMDEKLAKLSKILAAIFLVFTLIIALM